MQGKENMDKKNITIADVAEALKVSKTTVSRAISGKGRISEATRARVMNYIEEHDYRPNIIAKGLANSCTYNIGVVMPENYGMSDATFFIDCLSGLHETAAASGYDILLTICDNIDMSGLQRMVTNHKVDGVVLMQTFVEDKAISLLKEKEVPFVVIGSSNDPDVIQIDSDNESACRELTSILLMKQMKRVALIGGDENKVVSHKRLQGYLKAYDDAGIAVPKDLIYMNHESSAAIYRAVEELVRKGADCIACMDDNICVEVLNHLKKILIMIPNQMKVASFFNSRLLGKYVPSITSISFDVRKLGVLGAKTLIAMIEKEDYKPEPAILLGHEVILKESTF